MLKIKVSTAFPEWPLIRQTPASKGVWGDCKFFINQNIDECDYWVVYDGLLTAETVNCPTENTVLITGDPPNVKNYNEKYLKQFSTIITCHRNITRNRIIYRQQALPWHIGMDTSTNRLIKFDNAYDELKAKLNRVLGVDAGVSMDAPAPAPVVEAPTFASDDTPFAENESQEDDTLSYFARLAKES